MWESTNRRAAFQVTLSIKPDPISKITNTKSLVEWLRWEQAQSLAFNAQCHQENFLKTTFVGMNCSICLTLLHTEMPKLVVMDFQYFS
jgi:hypothetical protein